MPDVRPAAAAAIGAWLYLVPVRRQGGGGVTAALCPCPTCAARHQRQVEAAARARQARVAALEAEREWIVAEITVVWNARPELRENATCTARVVRSRLGLDTSRVRTIRKVAGSLRSGQIGTETGGRG